MSRLFVTGDIHGEIDINKLSSKNFPEQKDLNKDDYLLILGDFGLVWNNPRSVSERYWLEWLDSKPWTTLFVDGNHENHPLLNSYPKAMLLGGKVHKISSSIFHLIRGEIFNIDGLSFLAMGGACSHDKNYRTEGKSWWKEEEIAEKDVNNALKNIKQKGSVNFVFSHCLPTFVLPRFFSYIDGDVSTDYLENIWANIDCSVWMSGHYHINKNCYAQDTQFFILYDDITEIKKIS